MKWGVLRTQSVGSAAAEKVASAVEKDAGEEKRREQGRLDGLATDESQSCCALEALTARQVV